MNVLLVFLGGGIGSVLRFGVGRASMALFGAHFPVGTLLVNIIGSAALGLLAGWFAGRGTTSEPIGLLLAVGLLGGFTTFSAFSLDAVLLWQRGDQMLALAYILASLTLAVGASAAGLALSTSMAS